MLKYELIREEFKGEPAPVIYISGKTYEFHELLVALMPLVIEDSYQVTTKELTFMNEFQIFIQFSNKNNTGAKFYDNNLFLSFDKEEWILLINTLVIISFKPSLVYFDEIKTLKKIPISGVIESLN